MKTYIWVIFAFIMLWACSEDKTFEYKSVKYLYFTKPEIKDSVTFLSFTHYPNATEKEISLVVSLAGDLVSEATPYQLEIVTDSTTATAEQYKFDLIQHFPANQIKDTIHIKLLKQNIEGKEVTLYIRIVENENFTPGFKRNQAARIVFNDIDSKPNWWNTEIEKLFLGPWSAKKYAEFVISSGITDLTGYDFSFIRKVCLQFKKDIELKGLTENGIPMEVPVN